MKKFLLMFFLIIPAFSLTACADDDVDEGEEIEDIEEEDEIGDGEIIDD